MARQEIDDLALEIVKLEDQLQQQKKHNKQARLRCNLKKIKVLTKLGMIFSTIPLAGTLITSACGWNPFKLNEKEVPALVTTTIDKDGQEEETIEYKKEEDSKMYYYTNWEPTENNNWTREVYTYTMDTTEENIYEILQINESPEEITLERIEELMTGRTKPYSSKYTYARYSNDNTEYSATVTEEELNRGAYVEAKIRTIDESDVKMVQESLETHNSLLFLKIVSELAVMIVTYVVINTILEIRRYPYNYKFLEKEFKELKTKPRYIDTKQLEQQLKAKLLIFNMPQYQLLSDYDQTQIQQSEKQEYQKTMTRQGQ